LQGPDTSPTDASDVIISPYTRTYLDDVPAGQSNIANGISVHPQSPSTDNSSGCNNQIGISDANADLLPNRLVLPPVNSNQMKITDSPYIQMPSPPGESSGTGISPYTVVEQTLLESLPQLTQPFSDCVSNISGPSAKMSDSPIAAAESLAINDDRHLSQNNQANKLPSVAPAVDGYVSWPPPEPSSNEL